MNQLTARVALFGRQREREPIDPRLRGLIPAKDKWLPQIASREQETIFSCLREGEDIRFFGRSEHSSSGIDPYAAVVVTSQRVLVILKNQVRRDVARGRITQGGMPYDARMHKHKCALRADSPAEALMVYIEDFERATAFLSSVGFSLS